MTAFYQSENTADVPAENARQTHTVLKAERYAFASPVSESPEWMVNSHLISIHLARPTQLEMRQDDRRRSALFLPGDLALCPALHLSQTQFKDPAEYALLHLDPALIENVAEISGDPARVEIVPQFKVRDPLIEQIGLTLLAEADTIADNLYVDALAQVLAVHLIKKYSGGSGVVRESNKGLSPRRLRRALDYINDNLTVDISLTDVAEAAGMSGYAFARGFKQATGQTPYQYFIRQRIEHARILLAQTEHSIIEIAYQLGFSSQSHFTKVFRSVTGTTPKIYRDNQ